jgi:hypothetical protein
LQKKKLKKIKNKRNKKIKKIIIWKYKNLI